MILCLMNREQRLAAERFHPNEHLKTACPSEETHQFLLLRDLSVALNEEWNVDLLGNHLLEQIVSLGILVEVVGCEHHHPNTRGLCMPQALHRRFDRLAAHLPAGDFDDRAEVAGEG